MSCAFCAAVLRAHPETVQLRCGNRDSIDKLASLGPSNDAPPEVAIEMRAAEIAQGAREKTAPVCETQLEADDCEGCGWDDYVVKLDCDQHHHRAAGWLACHIFRDDGGDS